MVYHGPMTRFSSEEKINFLGLKVAQAQVEPLMPSSYKVGNYEISWTDNVASTDFTFKTKVSSNSDVWTAFALSKDSSMVLILIKSYQSNKLFKLILNLTGWWWCLCMQTVSNQQHWTFAQRRKVWTASNRPSQSLNRLFKCKNSIWKRCVDLLIHQSQNRHQPGQIFWSQWEFLYFDRHW